MKVVIGAPTFKYLSAEAHGSHMIAAIENASEGWIAGLVQSYDVFIDDARNEIVSDALKYRNTVGATHLWFIDDDMILPRGSLSRLARWNVPVVSGLYFNRGGDPVVYKLDPSCEVQYLPEAQLADAWAKREDANPLRVAGVGLGCILIQLDVLNNMLFRFGKCFDTRREKDGTKVGEDVVFCENLRLMNVPLYLDYGLVCGHAKTVELLGRE